MLANTRARRECGNPHDNPFPPAQTTGWIASCKCEAERIAALVLDPFSGTASTGIVCQELGLRYIGLDLSESYCRLALARLRDAAKDDAQRERESLEERGQQRLFFDARTSTAC
jgi:hypothetical protein